MTECRERMECRPKPHAVVSHGQGAAEYIMLLGSVLLITLIAIFAMNAVYNYSQDARIMLSESYWGSTTPLAINSHTLTTNGMLTLEVVNRGPMPLRMQGVRVGGDNVSGQNMTTDELASGRKGRWSIDLGDACKQDGTYELFVNFTYADLDSELPGQILKGREPLVGRCNGITVQNKTKPQDDDCDGKLCNGWECQTPNECESHHCHPINGTKICVECEGNGHCEDGKKCVEHVCG